jgi:hypothetical protein
MPQSMGLAFTMNELARPGTSSRPTIIRSAVTGSMMDRSSVIDTLLSLALHCRGFSPCTLSTSTGAMAIGLRNSLFGSLTLPFGYPLLYFYVQLHILPGRLVLYIEMRSAQRLVKASSFLTRHLLGIFLDLCIFFLLLVITLIRKTATDLLARLLYMKASTFSSRVLTGYFNSYFSSTVGCRIPKEPMTWSLPPMMT